MSTFTAKYRSRCEECDEPIQIGDRVTYDAADEFAIHLICAPDPGDPLSLSRRRIPVVVCDECHLTRPCDCGDAA